MDLDKLLIKLAGNGFIVVLFLMMLTDASFLGALVTALLLSIVAWFLGDRFLLPRSSNVIATAADGVLAAMVLWAAARIAPWEMSVPKLIGLVVILGAFEALFHFFLQRRDPYYRGEAGRAKA
ncbi:DUF2512 family protein [Paenibacillus mucilaginosus]|uniref:DUF2512 family protein n=3 Tax=Paenibacillus mucilaginosus TaxID=61624 RepID=H6N8U5_9BACL|nr:DUF2512 family protein [Paenibacillus mucilaginosus]AEI38905.1 hypothetical protein KNP414_00280 [Paenibacillus mucilaginosus KNP414]AFC27219.1 hypothetical protein PM3016_239 [Paenibacillus mucilaginosus 3016]AFH59360.1 hypothetical protein B2K_01225 [Paenibacillus mucilaginosus K02]MCG7216533.1 YndM family protein [Paenibacillus mucilaginosus]WDM27962.1 DUF2512 family protein [Paenibacillus mucilaginosus]